LHGRYHAVFCHHFLFVRFPVTPQCHASPPRQWSGQDCPHSGRPQRHLPATKSRAPRRRSREGQGRR
jgi:hypothetical protein